MNGVQGGIRRVLLVATDTNVPGPTYSGPSVIRWGLIKGFQASGVEVGFYAANSSLPPRAVGAAAAKTSRNGRIWLGRPGPAVNPESVAALAEALCSFRPDVVLTYGAAPVRLVRATGYTGALGIMSIDLEFVTKLHHLQHSLRFGDARTQLWALRAAPRTVRQAWQRWHTVRRDYPLADFVINHAAHHAEWHRRQHGRKVLYVPNPVSALYKARPVPIPTQPPRFLLLGGLGGIATRSGLGWFATRVYPLLEPAILAGQLEIHLAGRDQLPAPLGRRMRHVVQRGYVEDLADELRRTTAMVVPTPIKLGFRTRILEAFRHGVAVIAHGANAAGMPELVHGRNALLASNGRDFADAVLRLAKDSAEAERLGRAGFDEFTCELNAAAVARRVLDFIGQDAARP